MLSCKQMTELSTEAAEGHLTFGQRLAYRFHFAMCKPCRSYNRQMKRTIATLREIPPPAVSPETRDALLARFRQSRTEGR